VLEGKLKMAGELLRLCSSELWLWRW